MKNKKILILITLIIVLIAIFTIVLTLKNSKASEEPVKQIGEVVGYLTIEDIGIDDLEVRNMTNSDTLEVSLGLYDPRTNSDEINNNICLIGNVNNTSNYTYYMSKLKTGSLVIYRTIEGKSSYYAVQNVTLIPENESNNYFIASEESKLTFVTPVSPSTTSLVLVQATSITN